MSVTIRLSESMEKRLDELAKLTGRTKSYYIRLALEEKLEEMEDLYTAEYRLEQPEGKRWSLQELERGDDLDSKEWAKAYHAANTDCNDVLKSLAK